MLRRKREKDYQTHRATKAQTKRQERKRRRQDEITSEETLAEATSLGEATNKIIADLEKMGTATFYSYRYSFSATGEVKFDEVVQEIPIVEYLAEIKTQESDVLEEIFDVFNDKIDYKKFSTWADVVEKNKLLSGIALRCTLLRDKESTLKVADRLCVNLSRIHEIVQRVQTFVTSQCSRMQEMQSLVYQINELSGKLKAVAGSMVNMLFDSEILAARMDLQNVFRDWYAIAGTTLLYRATRDGFSATAFHKKCDQKGATLTVIRSGTNIFGGYATVSWTSRNVSASDPSASLFSLVNPAGTDPVLYHVEDDVGNAVFHNPSYGPIFGGGHDLYLCSNSNAYKGSYSRFPHSYADTTGRGNTTFTGAQAGWLVNEIEVFQVK